jgi:hypothetical protein
MKDAVKVNLLSRRDFLQMSALTLGALVFRWLHNLTRLSLAMDQEFFAGANYPWIAYGHDFGKNAWGHDGTVTCGWTYQTYTDSQGFTDTRRCTGIARSGSGSLCITADLVGQHPNQARGEVYLDLNNHAPLEVSVPVNLTNVAAHCWLRLPPGSAGYPSARNGVQLFFKSEGWYSFYSPWMNIQPEWEDHWVEFTANPSGPAGYQDPQFDPMKVIAMGVKVAINDASTATLHGLIYLDDCVLDTTPPLAFDFEQLEVERDLITLKCSASVVRVFVFADGRASPEFSSSGEVTGFDEYFLQDFDALLETAMQQNLQVIPVLLDFSWCNVVEYVNGVQLGGHSDVIRDAAKRQSFLDNALKLLVQRYAANSQVLAWEVINEPEWVMQGIPGNSPIGDPVTIQQMQDFVKACTDVVHLYSSHQVTVGSARRKWLQYWKGLGLDFYQFHWYDHFAAEEPFPWPPYSELGLDKPCIIGEVPTANTAYSVKEYLDAARTGGYHGLLIWSYRARDTSSSFSNARPYLESRCVFLPRVSR